MTEEFKNLADSVATFYAYGDLPMVVVPHPFVTLGVDEVRAIADAKAPEVFARIARTMDIGPLAGADATG